MQSKFGSNFSQPGLKILTNISYLVPLPLLDGSSWFAKHCRTSLFQLNYGAIHGATPSPPHVIVKAGMSEGDNPI